MDALDGAEASAILAVLAGDPRSGVVVFRVVPGRGFEVVRSNAAAAALLGATSTVGRRFDGDALAERLAALVSTGTCGEAEVPLDGGGSVTAEVRVVGDHVVLLVGGPHRFSYRALLESSPDVLQLVDIAGDTRYVTASAETVLGYPVERLVGRHFREMVDPRDLAELEAAFAEVLAAPPGAAVEREFRFRHCDGDSRWLHGAASNHLTTPGVEGVVVRWRDNTIPRELRSRLEYAATHDALTGLANRCAFIDHLQLRLAAAERRPDAPMAVLFCDLDRFKSVNDSLGHAAGDDLLRQVGDRLRHAVRPGDTVARLGGDEFAVLCDDLSGPHHAVRVAQRALDAIAGTYRLQGAPRGVDVGASVGVAVTEGRSAPEQMLREADLALYEAKRRGRCRVEVFREGLRESVAQRIRLEADLRHALDAEEFELRYQPKLDLRRRRIPSAEALLRWRHRELGMLLPAEFLELAVDTGLIVPLGYWVVRTATRQVADWSRGGLDLAVQVNFSARELIDPALPGHVDAAVAAAGIDRVKFELEITEAAAAADLESTIASATAFRERGMHVALDDFGTRYSSLSWLQQIPVDIVKLDKSFIAGLGAHPGSTTIVEAVLHLSRALGLATIAEGVESADELSRLLELGCDAAQGNHIAPPMEAGDFYELAGVVRRR
jgi:diguanylate cyclase (GGDEF)-like protein/PAS domain S-box-containing protein